ncbi:cysteine methyltransferase [Aeromicrobium sp. A1-2]|uniref:MGMT family protein n=1 Tax=Aeromicrobium sp. A1-2 TaxID=2107713 RepID=UPI000E495ACD|nr:MGMT family protein [Aeromicrobium sp. A1-2]AXT84200.1 cysteine methyltransferase [Aeromicrobium sp. A1-2]
MSPDFTERVLDLVERIPPGRVLSYGIIAEILQEGGPRQVGRVMALEGGAVAWWRVVRADGSLPPSHGVGAQEHYAIEDTPMRNNGSAVDMARALWQFDD